MNAVSLFSGVGMFDLGVSLAGFNIIAQVEIDDYCRRVLERHSPSYWPDSKQFTDVTEFGKDDIYEPVDLIFGGFPCQPHSFAGSRQGGDDSRNLWPEFKRIIGELRPRAVMLENVPGIAQAYQVEGELRPAYALTVIADLAALGYDARWGIISAADCGAPHNRARWWCVAYANCQRCGKPHCLCRGAGKEVEYSSVVAYAANTGVDRWQRVKADDAKHSVRRDDRRIRGNGGNETMGITKSAGLPHRKQTGQKQEIGRFRRSGGRCTESGVGRAAHGITDRLVGLRWPARPNIPQYGWEAPRTVEPRTINNRVARVKALGNGGIWVIAYALACEIRERIAR